MHYGALIAIASKQYGCFTRAQALSVMSARQLEWLISTGGTIRCHTHTYALAGFDSTWHQRSMAAALSIKHAVVSHNSAAQLWGLTKFNAPQISLTVPKTWSGKRYGIDIHRSIRIDAARQQVIPVSSAVRTLVDLAGTTLPNFWANTWTEHYLLA